VRVVFLGTAEFACPSLKLLSERHEVPLVITQPDRPAGRKGRLRQAPVKLQADKLGLNVAQPVSINSEVGLTILNELSPDVIVVVAYGQILCEQIFTLPPLGTINIHASLLPKYRGAAPINWAIIKGETQTGVSSFLIETGVDTGKILLQRAIPIGVDETAGELHDRLAVLGAQVLLDTLAGIKTETIHPQVQHLAAGTAAPKLTHEDGRINWGKGAKAVHNQVRGMNPWPGAFTYLGERRVKIHRAKLTGIACGQLTPGQVQQPESDRLLVATADNLLQILEIQPQGRRRMSGQDFLNGRHGQPTSFS
jgi:methionyl-tRNA formyltransferase